MRAEDLVRNAIEEEREAAGRRKEQHENRVRESREYVAQALPDETWRAVGIDPSTATFKKYGSREVAEAAGSTEVEGREIATAARADLGSFGNGVTFEAGNAHATLTSDERSHAENTRKVGFVLAQALGRQLDEEEARKNADIRDLETRASGVSRGHNEAKVGQLEAEVGAAGFLPGEKRAELLKALASARRRLAREREQAEARRREREAAEEAVIAAAEAFDADSAAYGEACKAWAEEETFHLWRPSVLHRVRYVPEGNVRIEVRYPSEEGCAGSVEDLVQEIVVVPGAADEEGFELVVTPLGVTTRLKPGAVLDTTPLRFDEPITAETVPYHRSHRAGAYVVNVPWDREEQPAPKPAYPASWRDRLEDLDLSPIPHGALVDIEDPYYKADHLTMAEYVRGRLSRDRA